jgi:CHAT domain-containing protein/tetratricopeptide (TPR) repeat protein
MGSRAAVRWFQVLCAVGLTASMLPAASAGGAAAQTTEGRRPVRSLIDQGRFAEAEAEARRHVPIAQEGAIDLALLDLDACDLLVEAMVRNGRGAEPRTREIAEQVVSARAARLGPQHPSLATSLRNLGDVLFQAGEYQPATKRFQDALAIRERSSPAAASELADDLDHLVRALTETDRYDEAVTQSNRALAIRKQDARASAVPLARTLHARGLLDQKRANYQRARADLEQALKLFEAASPEHPDTASALTHVGEQLALEGDLLQSRDVLTRAVALAERVLRSDHPEIAASLRSLAATLQEMGDLAGSLELRRRAVGIAERVYGADHALVAIQLNDLANTLLMQGEYASARRLYERARAIYVKRLGPDFVGATAASFNLALLHSELGDLQEARREFQRVIRTWQRVLGPKHPNVARAQSALAEALALQGLDVEARLYYQQALAIREAALGANHPFVAITLSQLAASLARLGQVRRASELSARSVLIWERSGGGTGLAEALVTHARILTLARDDTGAAAAYQRALDIRLPLLGPTHPSVAAIEVAFAGVQARLLLRDEALDRALKGDEISRNHARLTLGSLSERQALEHAASRPRGLDLALSLIASSPESTRALDALIRGRALTLDEIGSRQRLRQQRDHGELAPLWADLASARQRFANLAIREADDRKPELHAALVEEARREKEQIERTLAERSSEFRSELRRSEIGLADVRTALPPDTALVSFVRYDQTRYPATRPGATATRPGTRPGAGIASYLAFVYRPDTTDPAVVRLGRADALEALIGDWRRELITGITQPDADAAEVDRRLRSSGAALRQALWDPVAAHLKGVTRTFVVPDGAVSLVPLAALPSGRSRYLLETSPVIHYLSAERDVASADPSARQVGQGLLALGGPTFGKRAAPGLPGPSQPAGARPETTLRNAGSECPSVRSIRFEPLPATRREAEEIAALWRNLGTAGAGGAEGRVLTGQAASEPAVKELGPGRRVLHLATHGFFLADGCAPAAADTRGVGGLAVRPSTSRDTSTRPRAPVNPLLISGLALAGANDRAAVGPAGDDGILTAEEVSSLDLEGVEWAVLSACDTGLGEIKAGEGVFGLRRAFQIAGARTIIMSLWAVEDRATLAWMRALYQGRVERRLDTADAVRDASLAVLRDRRARGLSTHPFYWAGFVAAGDWR